MNANTHLHSRFSDGKDWPVDIVRRALDHRLRYLVLTDHDTLGGQGEFMAACQRFGVGATEGWRSIAYVRSWGTGASF